MISGISKKVIFFSFLFINFLQPSKSAEFVKINKRINNQNTKLIWSNPFNKETLPSFFEISDNNKSIANLTRLKEVLESAWMDATGQGITIAKLREVQNEIYQHRKTNRPISDRFYWKQKDEFEGDAQYSIEEMIAELEPQTAMA